MAQQVAGIQIPIGNGYTPRQYQMPFWEAMDRGCKRYFKRWTRRAGKDVDFWNFVVREAFRVVGNYYYIFPEYVAGKRAIWEGKTKAQIQYLDYIPKAYIKSKNSNEMKIELVNGSIIRIVGASDIDKLRGAGPKGIAISEFAYMNMDVLNVLTPMLLENDGWLIINSTPCGKNFMYDFEQTIKGDPNWIVDEIQSLWPDLPNYYPVYTTNELDEQLRNKLITYEKWFEEAVKRTNGLIDGERKMGKTEEWIEQEYGVSYIAGQKGAYFADCIALARKENRVGEFAPDMNKYVDVFTDLGYTDDTAIWFRQIVGNKLVWVDYYETNRSDVPELVNVLREKGYRYRNIYLPHDGKHHSIQTGITTAALARRLLTEARLYCSVITVDRPASKQIPINLTRERFTRYYFNESKVSDGLTKVSLYHRKYDKKTQAYQDKPAHDWTSHAADALTLEGLTGNTNEGDKDPFKFKIITDFDPLDY